MIQGALVEPKGELVLGSGKYKPEGFGRITLWQMRHLFGYAGKPEQFSAKEAFWNRRRIMGQGEFQIWAAWQDEVIAKMPGEKK